MVLTQNVWIQKNEKDIVLWAMELMKQWIWSYLICCHRYRKGRLMLSMLQKEVYYVWQLFWQLQNQKDMWMCNIHISRKSEISYVENQCDFSKSNSHHWWHLEMTLSISFSSSLLVISFSLLAQMKVYHHKNQVQVKVHFRLAILWGIIWI